MKEDRKPSRKRPLPEEVEDMSKNRHKRVRFPKGKKVKTGEEAVGAAHTQDKPQPEWDRDPHFAAKMRAKQRIQMTTEICCEESGAALSDVSTAEVNYEDHENFVDDGITLEPFNLDKEREDGYFDADGNFVEYVKDDEVKDAWLDSVHFDPSSAKPSSIRIDDADDKHELSPLEVAKIKRRIADLLEPGETVLQALKRLKGTSNNRKEKMLPETKALFDQLTEDAVRLMENGDYNVYHERQDVFEREAEGYERLAQAKMKDTFTADKLNPDSVIECSSLSNMLDTAEAASVSTASGEISVSNNAETFDIFAEDDETVPVNPSSDDGIMSTHDYVYDASSGYYYSSSLGYYYDPSSQLYCCASSGKWYSFNEETGVYEEIHEAAPCIS